MQDPVRLLVVDDEFSVCLSLSEFLTDLGFEVSMALSAEDAIKQLKNDAPALMIVDIRLPGMDGTKLIQNANNLHPQIKYLIHTGSVAFSIPEYLKKIGLSAENVLIKPVKDLKIFETKIREILKRV